MTGLESLLKAAKYLEQQGYHPIPDTREQRREKHENSRITKSRSTHNQLEKKRRAHLRTCMESLRSSVPALNGNKATTLSLLEGARDYIEALKSTASKTVQTQEKLRKQRELLRKRISDLELQVNALGGQGYVPQKWASKDNEEENIEVDVVSSEDDCLSSFSGGSDGCAADNRI